jgi:capsular exopolysaccharide synthesis family protein
MSRIQDILEKARSEGTLHRTRPVAAPVHTRPAAAAPLSAPRLTLADFPDDSGTPVLEALEAVEFAAPSQGGPGEDPNLSATRPVPADRVVQDAVLDPHLVAVTQGTGVAAEQYRALRTRIMQASHGGAVHAVLVTSPGRGEGKSLTVANLGLTMAQDYQRRICVLDADFRAPQQHRLFGLRESPGLSDVLLGSVLLDEALIMLEEHRLTVLPAGVPPANPAELLGMTAMRRTLDTLRSRFDRILIDAPAATPLADIGVLMPLVDRVLLVVRAGFTSKPAIHDAVSAIDPAKFIGLVLNEAA